MITKAFCWLLISLPLSIPTEAQVDSGKYNIWTIGSSVFFPSGSTKDVVSSFSYTSTSVATGNTTTAAFKSAVPGSYYSKAVYLFNLSNLEVVSKHHSINIGGGLFKNAGGDHGGYFESGYRYLFPMGAFLLKIGGDAYYLAGKSKRLGSIDNAQKEIRVGKIDAPSQYLFNNGDEDGNVVSTDTINASRLNISYNRNSFLLAPKLILAVKPVHHWTLSLEAGYMLQLGQSTSYDFSQTDENGGHSRNVGHPPAGRPGGLSGPFLSLNIGWAGWQSQDHPAAGPQSTTTRP